MPRLLSRGLPSAGLYVGPAAWLVSTQANYVLVPWSCAHGFRAVPLVALPLIAVSLAGGYLSWRALGGLHGGGERAVPEADGNRGASLGDPKDGKPHRLVAAIGILTALLFALAITVHGVAGLVFDGCER
jgi:hypothetical protein